VVINVIETKNTDVDILITGDRLGIKVFGLTGFMGLESSVDEIRLAGQIYDLFTGVWSDVIRALRDDTFVLSELDISAVLASYGVTSFEWDKSGERYSVGLNINVSPLNLIVARFVVRDKLGREVSELLCIDALSLEKIITRLFNVKDFLNCVLNSLNNGIV